MPPKSLDINPWHEAISGDTPIRQIGDDFNNSRNIWQTTVLDAASRGDSLLELGCGNRHSFARCRSMWHEQPARVHEQDAHATTDGIEQKLRLHNTGK
jgi:hypothetical protein